MQNRICAFIALVGALSCVALSGPATAAEKCAFHPWQPRILIRNAYQIHELTQDEKRHTIIYIQKTEGEPPPNLESYMSLPAYIAFQHTAHWSEGPDVPDKGAIAFTDAQQKCIVLMIGSDETGDIQGLINIIHGKWRLSAY